MLRVLLRLGVVGHVHHPDWPQKSSEPNSTAQLNCPKAFPIKQHRALPERGVEVSQFWLWYSTKQHIMSRPLTPLKFDFGTPVRHVDKIHSCKHCERITIESHHLQDWKGKGAMVPLPHTKAEARLAAQDKCPLFEHLARLSKPAVSRRELWEVLKICI